MIKQTEVTAHLLEILNETGKISVVGINNIENLISDLEVLGYDVS